MQFYQVFLSYLKNYILTMFLIETLELDMESHDLRGESTAGKLPIKQRYIAAWAQGSVKYTVPYP